jgi:hypothetical protein
MDIYEARQQVSGKLDNDVSKTMDRERREIHQLADVLARNSARQWQKTIEGIVALPAAIATGFAATTLRTVAIVTGTLEAVQRSVEQSRQLARAIYDAGEEHRVGGNETHERLSPPGDQSSRSVEAPRHS